MSTYTLMKDLTVENVQSWMVQGTKALQSQSAQLRYWARPDLDPESKASRNLAGDDLDRAMNEIGTAIVLARVGLNGFATEAYFASLQSVFRNTWPALNGKGAGVSVRYLACSLDSEGSPTKAGIKPTKAYVGAMSVSAGRIGTTKAGDPTQAHFAFIAWKQGVTADILDPIGEITAVPGGDLFGNAPERSEGEKDHEAQYQPSPAPRSSTDDGTRYGREAVLTIAREQRGQGRLDAETELASHRKNAVLASFMLANCHGEVAAMLKTAAMVRFGLVEAPAIVEATAIAATVAKAPRKPRARKPQAV